MLIAAIFTAAAAVLSFTSFEALPRKVLLPRLSPGLNVLVVFALIVLLFGISAVIRYWQEIRRNEDLIYYGFGLFLAMVAGMFVRAIAANHREGKPLFQLNSASLIFPLLSSLVVFYPIWTLAADAPRGLFPIHAAFLNGYFWDSIVAGTKAPAPQGPVAR